MRIRLKKPLLAQLTIVFMLCGCAGIGVKKGEQWPVTNAKQGVREPTYLDLALRVLALEMNQEALGARQYFMQFFPQQGRIEVSCRFLSTRDAQQKDEIEREVKLVQAGVEEILNNLQLRKGFDAKKNLYIRFETNSPDKKEIAIYDQGQVRNLTLPTGKN